MATYDRFSGAYEESALVQRKAGDKLIGLLALEPGESVIDIGCGPGHLTARLAAVTGARVLGTDVSEAMVAQARKAYPDLEFRAIAAEDLDYQGEFDVVFCNSALQWFTDPDRAVSNMYKALASSGRVGLAGPGSDVMSPWLDQIVGLVAKREDFKPVFNHWNSPWFTLPSEDAYRSFFENHGFETTSVEISRERTEFSVEEAFNIYLSGGAVGYTGKEFYDIEIDDDYINRFNAAVSAEIEKQSMGGRVEASFNRLYYTGLKT